MIEQALYQHLQEQEALRPYLATYMAKMAIFNQEAPADTDPEWTDGPQYGRIVYAVDLQGNPERIVGGMLAVDILCKEDEQFPEEIEPILRPLIHGYFFSCGKFVASAQWKNTSYFTEPANKVTGCTVAFDLLAFPVLTTSSIDVIARLNKWTSEIEGLYVINEDELPAPAWKPKSGESAVYWRRIRVGPSAKIRDRYATIWRTATIKGHIFSEDIAHASAVAEDIIFRLYSAKRLLQPGESPIMVDDRNTLDDGADPLMTGQLTVEATYGINRYAKTEQTIQNIQKARKETS